MNARRFWIGEKDRPVMAPEGFVYLVLARVGPPSGARGTRGRERVRWRVSIAPARKAKTHERGRKRKEK